MVRVDVVGEIHVVAVLDYRQREILALVHAAGAVRVCDRLEIARTPRTDEIAVHVEPADALVQIEKLLLADVPGVQRPQAVLHAHVVVWPTREASGWIEAERVDDPVVVRPARAAPVRRGS